MAAHGHDHADAHATAHDAHDDFDPEPAKELSPGEPTSPAWLPVLGACLFLAGGIYFLARSSDAKTDTAPSASAAASAAVAPTPPPPTPAGSAAPKRGVDQLPDPARRKEIDDMLRARMGASAARPTARPTPPPAPPVPPGGQR